MALQDELESEAGRRHLMERLLGVADGSGTLSMAVLVGGLGAAAFVASMAYDWQKAIVDLTPTSGSVGDQAQQQLTFHLAPASVDGLGSVYVLAMLGLLVIIGSAISWPHLAQRLRIISTGLGVGVIGVLIALTVRLPNALTTQQGSTLGPFEYQGRLSSSHEAGLYFAFLAVVLSVTAVWLAGPSIRRSSAPSAAAEPASVRIVMTTESSEAVWAAPAPAAPAVRAVPIQPAPVRSSTQDASAYAPPPYGFEPGTVNGLSVSGAEPIDLTVHPGDAWPR
jgi:hypothetical protein